MTTEKSLTEQEVAKIREDFEFFDRDQNGQIDLAEFIEMLTVLSPKTKANRVEEGFSLIDDNNDGYISFEEFLSWWQSCWWEY